MRLGELAGTMIVVSFLVYLALELDPADVAAKVLGQFSTPEQRQLWLAENGYNDPFLARYFRWLWEFAQGDWGTSIYFNEPVIELLPGRLANTGLLGALALLVLVPLSFLLGILAGMSEGSKLDRTVSFFCIVTTSIPEYASAVFLSAVFVFLLGWLPGASTMIDGMNWRELVLPVSVLVLYSTGYLARMTRASMVEVMSRPYIRAAKMKGASFARIVVHHALRNALIAPVTVVLLHIPWLLSGVIVVEVFFAYKGFGSLLYQAALYSDIYLLEACAMISVVIVVATQLASDLAYIALNPRISFDAPTVAADSSA